MNATYVQWITDTNNVLKIYARSSSFWSCVQCDVHIEPSVDTNSNSQDEESMSMALTKGGTLPGIVAVWSDGSVSLHVITADIISTTTAATTTKTSSTDGQQHPQQHHPHRAKRATRQTNKRPELELRQLWRVYPFEPNSDGGGGENISHRDYGGGGGDESSIEFEELGITFESRAIYGDTAPAVDESLGKKEERQFGENGAILLGGRYILNSKTRRYPMRVSFHALDALSGTSLWELKGNHRDKSTGLNKAGNNNEPRIPIIHTTSSARRRSHLPVADVLDPELDNENDFVEGDDVMTSEECMIHFRASVLDSESGALPHESWHGEFGSMSVGRFDRSKGTAGKRRKALGKRGLQLINTSKDGPRVEQKNGITMTGGGIGYNRGASFGMSGASSGYSGTASSGRSWQSDLLQRAIPQRLIRQQIYKARHPHMGKPNVVIFHGHEGLAVVSLKNGLPVCHISLMDHALYADVDQDGVIDTLQVITTPESYSKSSSVKSLIHRIAGSESERQAQDDAPVICHALVTSGLPPREEVFTAPLCVGGPTNPNHHLSAAPPLLVEGSLGYGNDVVFAMNNGVVSRYDFNGREVWRKRGGMNDGTPSWNSVRSAGYLGRIQFGPIREAHSSVSASSHRNQHRPGSPVRPILLSGDDGAALISPASGKVLCSVVYPQNVASQPLLVDLTGDGTDDMLVVSKDAIWGYRIVVETGRSGGFVIIVVTLLIGVGLAALMQKTNQRPGHPSKRSTDI